ncbi:glutathione S-transferase family protein [Roseateles toxinivorans]|uniref:Glutathione S-transferase n=1 Tax=Roseateles toxinivorans TaxID=270368 RepID=A0A4R6QJ41_9BURK|nr:glutathione S-transferase family protein [Roseateles toxinivorans]TDP62213.1 glutathione S-transferase [Roseateles toxinivorans]
MKLYIGNKNYSSWSMRPWVLLKALDIPFEEVMLRFDFSEGSAFYRTLAAITPVAKVPVLVDDDGFAVWDTLAIAEYLADRHPELAVWPRDRLERARARSLCAEMHAGFGTLRSLCPMNIEAFFPEIGARLMAENAKLRTDLARIDAIFSSAVGPFLFGAFGAVDAYFAPVVMRITRFGLPLSPAAAAYVASVQQAPGVAAWVADALTEQDFVADDEPYRTQR